MTEDKIQAFHEKAKRYARKHSSSRCAKAGAGCPACRARGCDFRAAARAYMAGAIDGWDEARSALARMPWDEAVRELACEALAAELGGNG